MSSNIGSWDNTDFIDSWRNSPWLYTGRTMEVRAYVLLFSCTENYSWLKLRREYKQLYVVKSNSAADSAVLEI